MPEILEHVAYLSQEIGPRPAGTEEEQQAALYITEQLQKDAGLPAVIEDFNGASDNELPTVICCAASVLAAVAALASPVLGVPSLILALVAAGLFAAEAFDKPVLSRVLPRGVSQNVVAKYEPGSLAEQKGARRRKVVIVSRYDSGKVRAELTDPLVRLLPAQRIATLGGVVALPLILVIRNVAFPNATGALAAILNVLVVIAMVLAAIPLVFAVLHRLADYNEAANSNAAGVAVLLEVARRVGRGRVSEADIARQEEAAIHGEEAARAAGLVPEGAELVYEAQSVRAPEPAPQTDEARLVAAKAAIAALTGKPVSGISADDIAKNLVQIKEQPIQQPTESDLRAQRGEAREALGSLPPDTMQTALANAEAAAAQEAEAAAQEALAQADAAAGYAQGGVPDWFRKAQEKAKRPRADKPVQRSRYASALDAAVSESAGHFAEANRIVEHKLEQRLDFGRDEIREVKAPQWNAPAPEPAVMPASDPQAAPAFAAEEASEFVEPLDERPIEFVPAPGFEPPAPASFEPAFAPIENSEVASPVSETEPVAFEAEGDGFSPDRPDVVDPFATRMLTPIIAEDMGVGDIPTVQDVPMPSFLDPRKAQEEALAARQNLNRTSNRVDVTDAAIGDSGRIEVLDAEAAPSAAFVESGYPVEAADPSEFVAGASGEVVESPEAIADAPSENQPRIELPEVRRPITLPDIGTSPAKSAPLRAVAKQRAPLADVESSGKAAAKSLLNMLPSINLGASDASSESGEPDEGSSEKPAAGRGAALRSMLPSLSGAISRSASTESGSSNVNAAGAFVPAGATGAFAPIGDELLDNVDPDDVYVEDADDSVYDEQYTETGAFAGPGYVEMPKSRIQRLFDKFRRNKNEVEETPQEWLDVDDSFDARTVGAERGGWESFREDADRDAAEAELGATQQFVPVPYDEEDDENSWQGGAYSPRRMERSDLDSEEISEEAAQAAAGNTDVPEELQQIYQFRNPDVNTEVWFVALGSELSHNGGMRAFMAEHAQELRGAIVVDLDSLGAGTLCMVEQEGPYKRVKPSSRIKRYVKKASQATGLNVGTTRLLFEDSAASYALRNGVQSLHLVGMDGAKPALYGQADDMLENIDEATLVENADYVMELIKNV